MKKNLKNKKGFTFLEVIVAIGIFSLVSVVVVAVFANIMKTNNEIRSIQQKIELAGTTMESMAKIIRMSDNIDSSDSNNIFMRNTSQLRCIRYNVASPNIRVEEFPIPVGQGPEYCGVIGNYNDGNLVDLLDDVSASFAFTPSTDSEAGKVTILMNVGRRNLQTTVSFLDYQ